MKFYYNHLKLSLYENHISNIASTTHHQKSRISSISQNKMSLKILKAKPDTDIWRKPPSTNAFNATTNLRSPIKVSQFRRAALTVSASWRHLYDQGGLLLILKGPQSETKWLKVGIEYYENKPYVSTVGCDAWADWSIFPLTSNEASIEVRREEDINGKGLWCYLLRRDENGQITSRQPLREVAWFFAETENWQMEIGEYAARPAKSESVGNEDLEVYFPHPVEIYTT